MYAAGCYAFSCLMVLAESSRGRGGGDKAHRDAYRRGDGMDAQMRWMLRSDDWGVSIHHHTRTMVHAHLRYWLYYLPAHTSTVRHPGPLGGWRTVPYPQQLSLSHLRAANALPGLPRPHAQLDRACERCFEVSEAPFSILMHAQLTSDTLLRGHVALDRPHTRLTFCASVH